MRTKAPRKKDNFDWEHVRVQRLFAFLNENRAWNEEFQAREYAACLAGCGSAQERLLRFLHFNVSTQAGASMDQLSLFWKTIHNATAEQTCSLEAFTEYLIKTAVAARSKNDSTASVASVVDRWEALFDALNAHRGWGKKTTALFVKATINLHRGPAKLHFWSDATPNEAPVTASKLYLPVDRVILKIFEKLTHPCPSLDNINRELRARYHGEQMLVWDDLWFWGFFTQNGSGTDRVLGWNSAKFWNQLSSAKGNEREISALAEQFLKFLCRA